MGMYVPMSFEFHQAFLKVSADFKNDANVYEIHSKIDVEFSMDRANEPDDLSGEEPEFAAEVLRLTAERKVRIQAMLDLLVGGKEYLLCKIHHDVNFDGWDKDTVLEAFEYEVDAESKMHYLNYLEIVRRTIEKEV